MISFGLASAGYPDKGGNHDLHFDAGGNLVMVKDAECIAQLVRQTVEFYQGEWFLDTTVGVPWFQFIYVEPFNRDLAEALLKDAILSVDGVTKITEFSTDIDIVNRGFRLKRVVVVTIHDQEVQI